MRVTLMSYSEVGRIWSENCADVTADKRTLTLLLKDARRWLRDSSTLMSGNLTTPSLLPFSTIILGLFCLRWFRELQSDWVTNRQLAAPVVVTTNLALICQLIASCHPHNHHGYLSLNQCHHRGNTGTSISRQPSHLQVPVWNQVCCINFASQSESRIDSLSAVSSPTQPPSLWTIFRQNINFHNPLSICYVKQETLPVHSIGFMRHNPLPHSIPGVLTTISSTTASFASHHEWYLLVNYYYQVMSSAVPLWKSTVCNFKADGNCSSIHHYSQLVSSK